jgi:hypothetical protein
MPCHAMPWLPQVVISTLNFEAATVATGLSTSQHRHNHIHTVYHVPHSSLGG